MAYRIKIEKFEGPLDLLLDLIEREKMDITEISLSKVADQYLEYIQASQSIDPTNLADFLSVAAKLILLKSKALLPELEIDKEEEESMEELKHRLKEYKRFKHAAEKIKAIYNNKGRMYGRMHMAEPANSFYPGESLEIEDLFVSAKNLVGILEKFQDLKKETIRETVSIKEKISDIQAMLSQKTSFKFNSIIKKSKNRVEAIVSFLALLELIKQKLVLVKQKNNFSDIEVENHKHLIENNG